MILTIDWSDLVVSTVLRPLMPSLRLGLTDSPFAHTVMRPIQVPASRGLLAMLALVL